MKIPVNKQNALNSGIVSPKDADKIVDDITIKIPNQIIYKHRLLMLDVIANTDWNRPIYFTGGSYDNADYLWMKSYLQLDGVCYKLVPIKTPFNPKTDVDMARIDGDKMYDIVKKWDWRTSGEDGIYYDNETQRNSITYRNNMARLADTLRLEDKPEKAEEILDLAMEKMPVEHFGYYTLLNPIMEVYYKLDKPEKARKIWYDVASRYQGRINYYASLEPERLDDLSDEISMDLQRYRSLVDMLIYVGDEEILEKEAQTFNTYLELFGYSSEMDEPTQDEMIEMLLNSQDSTTSDSL